MSQIVTEARNADLGTIREILQNQRARRLDVVVRPGMIRAEGGKLVVLPGEDTQIPSEDGVTSAAGFYTPTGVGDEGLGTQLGINTGYLKKLRAAGRTDLFDVNVNGMLHGVVSPEALFEAGEKLDPPFPPHDGNLLLRLLRGDDEVDGVLRAVLSPSYRIIDNLDVLLAIMRGIRQAGVTAYPDVADLSDRSMRVRWVVPELAAMAPKLLEGYRSPFEGVHGIERAGEKDRPGMRLQVDSHWRSWTVAQALAAAKAEGQGYPEGQEPVVFAGITATNSDTGDGARVIAPEIRIAACRNGLQLRASSDRQVHLGSRRTEAGIVNWSAQTDEAELALITEQTVDAVKTFLSPEWFLGQVREIETLAGVKVSKPEETIKNVTRTGGFTKTEADDIWTHALMSGATPFGATVGQYLNAVTSFSQTVASPDRAAEIDAAALKLGRQLAKAGA